MNRGGNIYLINGFWHSGIVFLFRFFFQYFFANASPFHCNLPISNGLHLHINIRDYRRVFRNKNCIQHISFKTSQNAPHFASYCADIYLDSTEAVSVLHKLINVNVVLLKRLAGLIECNINPGITKKNKVIHILSEVVWPLEFSQQMFCPKKKI